MEEGGQTLHDQEDAHRQSRPEHPESCDDEPTYQWRLNGQLEAIHL